jgi:hypothetical protein
MTADKARVVRTMCPIARVIGDMPSGVVWIRDGRVDLNHFTSRDAVLTGDALC